jgi:hypothetical protein
MGEKSTGKNYTSKGERRNVSPQNRTKRLKGTLEHAIRQRDAWQKGKNVVLTIPNPNTSETNKPFIKVKASEVWGDFRKQRNFMMRGEPAA